MLHALGLSPAEQALYELLVTRPPATVEELGELAAGQTWPVAVDVVLHRLEKLGLLARLPADPPRYTVVAVDVALDALIADRERSLAAARQRIGELAARFGSTASGGDPLNLVEVVHGRAAVEARLDELLRSVRTEMRGFDAPPYLGEAREASPIELEMLGRGVRYRVIYDRQSVDVPGRHIDDCVAAGEEARVTDLPMKLGICDNSVAWLPLRNDPVDLESWLCVHDSVLLDALSALFEMYWDRAVPLRVSEAGANAVDQDAPTETDRALLPLLVAGLTDHAIADHLGWHERTAHRHLHSMMERLDAATRFQAGYQAVRRGWLTNPEDGPDVTG